VSVRGLWNPCFKDSRKNALREKAAKKAAGRDAANASEARIEAAKSAVRRLSQDELVAFGRWFADFRAQHGFRRQQTPRPGRCGYERGRSPGCGSGRWPQPAVDGSEIVLKSVGPPPPAILNLLRVHKAEIVSAITAVNTGGRAIGAAEVAAHETCGSAAIGPLPVRCDCALPIAERLETW
jgi:hypothetical protein